MALCGGAAWLGGASPQPVRAQGTAIFLCQGPGGVPEYRNDAAGTRCKQLELPEVVTVPGAPRAGSGRRAGPGHAAPPLSARGEGATAINPAALTSGFPRVDPATQRARDNDRRAVLEHELRSEEARLAELRARAAAEPQQALREDIGRAEANTAALRRELANLRD